MSLMGIFLPLALASSGAYGGCGGFDRLYRTFHSIAKPKPLKKVRPGKYLPPRLHFELTKWYKAREFTRKGVYESPAQPILLDSLFEIYAMSYPRGRNGGALWHIRPREGAQQIPKTDGKNYVKLQTENDRSTAGFFRFFYRTVARDRAIGEYWATRESPELYQTLKQEWNKKNPDADADLHVNFETTGPDTQLQMARMRSRKEFTIGLASPEDKSFYIPTGEKGAELGEETLKVNPRTGRVKQHNTLAYHDWREAESAVWLSKPLVDHMRETSSVWLEVHQILKKRKLPLVKDIATKKMANKFIEYAKETKGQDREAELGKNGFTKEGAQWWRLAEIELYKCQRTYHSFDHLLSLLVRRSWALYPGDVITKFGPIQQRELDLHRWGLGYQGGEAPRQAYSPLLMLTYRSARDNSPLTLEKAIHKVTNGERQRLAKFSAKCPDQKVKEVIQKYLETAPYEPKEIENLAVHQRRRFYIMGKGIREGEGYVR